MCICKDKIDWPLPGEFSFGGLLPPEPYDCHVRFNRHVGPGRPRTRPGLCSAGGEVCRILGERPPRGVVRQLGPKTNTCIGLPPESWYTRGAGVPVFGGRTGASTRFGAQNCAQRPSEAVLHGFCRPTAPAEDKPRDADNDIWRALAATQPIEKFLSKSDLGGPNCLSPPGKPSIEVGGFAPHLTSWLSRREEAVWTPKIRF